MTEPHDNPDLDDVIEPHEQAHPTRRDHAKTAHPPDEDELLARTEQERAEVRADRQRE